MRIKKSQLRKLISEEMGRVRRGHDSDSVTDVDRWTATVRKGYKDKSKYSAPVQDAFDDTEEYMSMTGDDVMGDERGAYMYGAADQLDDPIYDADDGEEVEYDDRAEYHRAMGAHMGLYDEGKINESYENVGNKIMKMADDLYMHAVSISHYVDPDYMPQARRIHPEIVDGIEGEAVDLMRLADELEKMVKHFKGGRI